MDERQRDEYLEELRQMEHQTLKQLYKPRIKPKSSKSSGSSCAGIAAFIKELNTRRKGFQDHGNAVHGSALQEVEQEREVAHEVETVREVQKPVHFTPIKFAGLHRDIISFVKTGRLVAGSAAFNHMLQSLQQTGLGLKNHINSQFMDSKLFVSTEFPRTVAVSRSNDNFLRHITWVLWSQESETAMIITPEEAEHVIPLIRKSRRPSTSLLTYAAPVTRRMMQFNNLNYYTIPAMPTGWEAPKWLMIELGLFASRLYFEFEEYTSMRKYLGLIEDEEKICEIPDTAPEADGVEDSELQTLQRTRQCLGYLASRQSPSRSSKSGLPSDARVKTSPILPWATFVKAKRLRLIIPSSARPP